MAIPVKVTYYIGDEDPSSGEITYQVKTDSNAQALKAAVRRIINHPPKDFTGIDAVFITSTEATDGKN